MIVQEPSWTRNDQQCISRRNWLYLLWHGKWRGGLVFGPNYNFLNNHSLKVMVSICRPDILTCRKKSNQRTRVFILRRHEPLEVRLQGNFSISIKLSDLIIINYLLKTCCVHVPRNTEFNNNNNKNKPASSLKEFTITFSQRGNQTIMFGFIIIHIDHIGELSKCLGHLGRFHLGVHIQISRDTWQRSRFSQ